MKKVSIYIFLISFISISWYMVSPSIILKIKSNHFVSLSINCQKSKKYSAELDIVGKKESIETRVNLFMNTKANEFSCFDLELLEDELLAKRVSQEKINYLKLKSIVKDPKLIENMDSENQ